MPTGTLKRWNSEKGTFGFISRDDGGEDIFGHLSALQDGEGSVNEGDSVKYSSEYDDRKGKYRAERVSAAAPRVEVKEEWGLGGEEVAALGLPPLPYFLT